MPSPASAASKLFRGKPRGAATRLGVNATLYTFGSLAAKGVGFGLTVVLSWILAPEEYGVWGVALSAGSLLSVLLGLGLESAIRQMHVRHSEAERKSLYGTLFFFWLAGSGCAVLGLEMMGRWGWLDFFRLAPFNPYLRLVLWTSFLGLFVTATQSIFMTREEPVWVVRLTVLQALLNAGFVLLFTVGFAWGARGVLTGYLAATAAMAVISVGLVARLTSARFVSSQLRAALGFSLPLVPHAASNWAMSLSDRMIMDRSVPLGQITQGQIGHYNLGYQFGLLVSSIAMSVNNAFFPIADQCLNDPQKRHRLPALGTYALAVVCTAGLAVALLGGEIIRVATPARHHGAAVVVPWLALAFVFQGVYFIWSRGTWYAMKTAWMPAITGLSAAVGVGLNLVLIPQFGIRAAAIDLTAALMVLALANGWLAHKHCPIAWEYRRWLHLFGAGVACFAFGALMPVANPWLALAWKMLVFVVGFPLLLLATRFVTREEWQLAHNWLAKWRQARG